MKAKFLMLLAAFALLIAPAGCIFSPDDDPEPGQTGPGRTARRSRARPGCARPSAVPCRVGRAEQIVLTGQDQSRSGDVPEGRLRGRPRLEAVRPQAIRLAADRHQAFADQVGAMPLFWRDLGQKRRIGCEQRPQQHVGGERREGPEPEVCGLDGQGCAA